MLLHAIAFGGPADIWASLQTKYNLKAIAEKVKTFNLTPYKHWGKGVVELWFSLLRDSNMNIESFLMEKEFIKLIEIENTDLNFTGLYALRIKDINALEKEFKDELINFPSTIVYIGKGERTIKERMLEECRGISNGTFFRGVGCMIGKKPPQGSLLGYKNKNNYKFSDSDIVQIVKWMNENLTFNFLGINSEIENTEKTLIKKYCPIFNYTHNPRKSLVLQKRRKECRIHALTIKI